MNKPAAINPRAEKVPSLLAGKSEASEIVLGGYFALQHYAAYRRTHDIAAWWKTRAVAACKGQVIREAMQQLAQDEGGSLRERKFGDTVSFELVQGQLQGVLVPNSGDTAPWASRNHFPASGPRYSLRRLATTSPPR